MAAPITWRTIESNPIGEISRAMSSGQAGINLGFDSFQKILDRQQATDQANWNQEKTNKTNAYMNEVAGIETPEQLAAAEGRLRQMLVDGGAQIDQQAARQALGARLGQLQERTIANQKFGDTQIDREQAGIKDQHAALVAQGRYNEANALLENNTLRNEAPMYKSAVEAKRATTLQGRTDEEYRLKKQLSDITHPEQMAAAQDTTDARLAENAAARMANEYKAVTEKSRADISATLAADPAYSKFVSKGSVSVEDMTSDQVKAANTILKGKGLAPLDVFQTGDTDAVKQIEQKLIDQGHSTRAIAKVLGTLPDQVSTAAKASVGIDAVTRAYNTAVRDAASKVAEDKYGTVATPGHISDLRKTIDEFAGTFEGSTRENITKAANAWIQQKGIDGGNGLRILPSAEQLASILRTTDRSWYTSDAHDINKVLDDWAERSKTGAAEVVKNANKKTERELKAKLYETK